MKLSEGQLLPWHRHTPRVISCSLAQSPLTFISSFISLFTGCAGLRLLLFSGGLPSFSISAMFSLWYFCQYLRWGGERKRRGACVREREERGSGSCLQRTHGGGPAALQRPEWRRGFRQGFAVPGRVSHLLRCILRGPRAGAEPPLWVKGEVEWGEKTRQGEGRRLKHYMTRWWSEAGYFFSLSRGAQSQRPHPLSAQSVRCKQVRTRNHSASHFSGVSCSLLKQ